MGDHTAFFYGTLMAPPVLHRVIYGSTTPHQWQKDLITVKPALLQGYRRHKVKHADYPGILPETDTQGGATASVRGTVVSGLTDGDLWRLDIFEGSQYERRRVGVKVLRKEVGEGETVDESRLEEVVEGEVQAETYVWTAGVEGLESEEWDLEEFRREKMWAWVGEGKGREGVVVDEGFEDVDRAVRDGTGGRGVGGEITRQLEAATAAAV